jgi:DNA/RNA-binding domain of Phe-tRNA-synthetase-like protein
MSVIQVSVHPEIFQRLPGYSSAYVAFEDFASALPRIDVPTFMSAALKSFTGHDLSFETLLEHGTFSRWRNAYSQFGMSPGKYRSSIEALVRRALKDPQGVATGLPFVDIYNSVSLKWLTPLGAYDTEKLPTKKIETRLANPGKDSFDPLGGISSSLELKAGYFVHAAGSEILCFGPNHRDSKKTCLGPQSNCAIFCGEALDDAGKKNLSAALNELKAIVTGAGAKASDVLYLDAASPHGQLPSAG